MTITIRTAEAGDVTVLSSLGAELFEQTYAGSIPPDEMASHISEDFGEAQQLDELLDQDVVSLLVEDAGAPRGFAQVRRRTLPVSGAQASVELWRIYLDRQLHGRGIAQELLKRIGVIARDLEATGVWLAVWERNERAISFYAKHGFVPVGRQDFHVGGEVHCDTVLRASADAF